MLIQTTICCDKLSKIEGEPTDAVDKVTNKRASAPAMTQLPSADVLQVHLPQRQLRRKLYGMSSQT